MTQDGSSGLSSADPLLVLLDGLQIKTSSIIRVTGPSGLSALLWLCRHGFDRVGYIKPGASAPTEDADALIIAHTCNEAALARLLQSGPHVRDGGVLIFRSPLPVDVGNDHSDPIHRLLEAHGYRVETCIHGGHRELHVARRFVRHSRKAA